MWRRSRSKGRKQERKDAWRKRKRSNGRKLKREYAWRKRRRSRPVVFHVTVTFLSDLISQTVLAILEAKLVNKSSECVVILCKLPFAVNTAVVYEGEMIFSIGPTKKLR